MATNIDLIVIGMGVAGEAVAGSAGEAGLKVLGVEKKLVGGECAYWGCIPSKIMVRASDSLAEAMRVTGLAGDASIDPDWAPVARKIRDATDAWDDTIAVERHENERGGVFVRGEARIVGPRAIEVNGERFEAARGIVIATGQVPGIPPIEGLDGVSYWTNRHAIETQTVPRSMIVLGAGPVGLELAQTFRRFGSEITIVEMAERPLPAEEPENGDAMADALRAEGIALFTGVAARSVEETEKGFCVTLDSGEQLEAERLLVATGRRNDFTGLGLENVGLDPDARAIDVDEHLRAADGVWAVGDITGKGAFTHVGVYQGRIAAANIVGRDGPGADYRAVPRVTFTDPEVGSVGLSEAQARDRGFDVAIAVKKTAHSARGWIHGPGAEHGVIKLVVDAAEGTLLGGSAMGPAAGEIVGFLTLAVKEGMTVDRLRQVIYPYPTFVRGINDALGELSGI